MGSKAQVFGEQAIRQVEQLVQSLSWAIDIFDRGQREISTLPERLRLTRKHRGPSHDARRMRFTAKMCETMLALFGKPLYPAVAALTNVVLETETTVDQVRRRRGRKRFA